MNRDVSGYVCMMADISETEHERPATRVEVTIAGYRNNTETARRALASHDPAIRSAALTALDRCDALDQASLLAALSDPVPGVVRRAAELASARHRGAQPVDELLLGHLRGDDDILAEVAAFSLGERHQEEQASPVLARIIDALAEATAGHRDALTREAAVAALGSIGHPSGLAAVLGAAGDKATVRRRAVIALAAFEGPEVDAALERSRTDRDWQVRQAAEDLTAP
jgi:HEAT repeat protein